MVLNRRADYGNQGVEARALLLESPAPQEHIGYHNEEEDGSINSVQQPVRPIAIDVEICG